MAVEEKNLLVIKSESTTWCSLLSHNGPSEKSLRRKDFQTLHEKPLFNNIMPFQFQYFSYRIPTPLAQGEVEAQAMHFKETDVGLSEPELQFSSIHPKIGQEKKLSKNVDSASPHSGDFPLCTLSVHRMWQMGFILPAASSRLIGNDFLECYLEKDFMVDPCYWESDMID